MHVNTKARTIVKDQKIVHARGYVAALVALFIKRIFKTKFVFDMRGFWADERSEAGLWKKDSRIYRVAKYFEKQFFLKADYIISLTNSGKEEIAKLGYLKSRPLYIEVIPTCVDLEKFKLIPANKTPGQLSKKNTLVYVGSVSTWYMLKEMIDFAIMANKAGLADKFIIVTHETDYAKKALKIGCDDFISVVSANRDEVQNYISSASIGLAFYKPGYSRKGCCPTKLGEYLACGVPVIINSGVGDSDALVMGERVGVVLDEFSESEYSRAIDIIRGLLAEGESLRLRCRAAAAKCLSLETGVKRYIDVYRSLSLGEYTLVPYPKRG